MGRMAGGRGQAFRKRPRRTCCLGTFLPCVRPHMGVAAACGAVRLGERPLHVWKPHLHFANVGERHVLAYAELVAYLRAQVGGLAARTRAGGTQVSR